MTKGIILAGGLGTRLRPLTNVTNKHLIAVYNKPMILYPLGTLMKAGIKDFLIISGREHAGHFMEFLGSGREYNVKLSYKIQDEAGGIAQALLLAEDFADRKPIAVILGDNVFENNFSKAVKDFRKGAQIFLKTVSDPQRFGVAELKGKKVIKILEKPTARGELEITDVNNAYIRRGQLKAEFVRGFWSDAGTFDSLLKASNWVFDKFIQDDSE